MYAHWDGVGRCVRPSHRSRRGAGPRRVLCPSVKVDGGEEGRTRRKAGELEDVDSGKGRGHCCN
jgi:hypothetical protein